MMTAQSSWASLPTAWQSDRLKDIVAIRDEKVLVEDSAENYLELEDLEGGTGRILSRRDTLSVESAVTRFEKGDILFGKLRPYLEKYCQPDFDGYCTGEILAFFPRRIRGRFLFYCMGSDWLIQRCNALAYGAKMPRVNWPKQLALFDFPLPPLPEQKRIAAYLDASCAAIDRAVATKQQQLETLGALRKSIIQKAVTQGLNPDVEMKDWGIDNYGMAPAHWRKSKLRYQITVSNGKFASDRIVEGGQYPIYGGNGVMAYADEWNTEPPFIVVGRVGALCGNAHFVNQRAWVSDNALFVTTTHHHQFMTELLLAMNFNSQANNTAQPVITGTKIKNTYVLLPPRDEQLKIFGFIEQTRRVFGDLIANLNSQIETLTAYRKSLIHECVTGLRRITDADVGAVSRTIEPGTKRG